MAEVKVKYLNIYCNMIHRKEAFIRFEKTITLGELLDKIIQKSTRKFRDFVLDEEEKLKPHVWMLVGGQRATDLQRKLKDGEVVVFSLPLVGG